MLKESDKITHIKIIHDPDDGELRGLIFYSGDNNQIAAIGEISNSDWTNTTITLKDTELICGVSASSEKVMCHFQFLVADL